ncbi:uncharacterized protein LOC143459527 [Clavelina lepadiformis]|uniref:uncharacterized protein LOC143459527 n=1 Tax=Clavelina lepadiformis TaxID=159417 RepID=UPI0040411A59
MKVIIAGFSKTGTKSMTAAMLELGYNVYDYIDHFWYHYDEWNEIFTSGSNLQKFKQMYEDVDVVIDTPAFLFWENISQEFPDAKIILTVRNENSWYQSWSSQIAQVRKNYLFSLLSLITPTGRKLFKHNTNYAGVMTGHASQNPFTVRPSNETIMRRHFRQHQAYCLQNAPRDKLLVYNVEEGWEPLCNFLGKKVPEKPFPWENVGGVIVDELMKKHPAFLQMKKEFLIELGLLLGLGCFGVYRLFRSGLFGKLLK